MMRSFPASKFPQMHWKEAFNKKLTLQKGSTAFFLRHDSQKLMGVVVKPGFRNRTIEVQTLALSATGCATKDIIKPLYTSALSFARWHDKTTYIIRLL